MRGPRRTPRTRPWRPRRSGAISASRRVEAPSRHRRASSPGEQVVAGLFFDFEAVRISMLRTGPDGPVRRPGAVAARVRGLAAGAAVVPGAPETGLLVRGTFRGRRVAGLLPERGLGGGGPECGLVGGGRDPGDAHGVRARRPRTFACMTLRRGRDVGERPSRRCRGIEPTRSRGQNRVDGVKSPRHRADAAT